jgi:hypothetical protein
MLYRNPDGTYNGVKVMAALSGLSEAEVAWTFNRLKHLLHVEKKSADEAKAIVAEECKSKPWEAQK